MVSLPSFEALYEDAPCGMLVTAANGSFLRVNQTFCRWIGHAASDLVGTRTLQSLLTVGGKIFHHTHWAPLLQMQGSVREVKLDFVHADGHKIPFVMNAQRREWHGEALHEVAVFVAEDRHKYELELLKARKRSDELLAESRAVSAALMKAETTLQAAMGQLQEQAALSQQRAVFAEQMMGIVGHDLRNPLAVMKLLTEVLERVPTLTEDKRQDMAMRMHRAVSSGERLIADMLDFTAAKLGAGVTVRPQWIDLHSTVAQALADLGVVYPESQIRHVATGSAACMADPERIKQLLGNLITNAVTYGAPDHAIEVYTSTTAMESIIDVANRGQPIPADMVPSLFEPMTRGQVDGSKRSVGLGLFIVSEIARAHNGAVSVTSTEAQGTRFTVTLPHCLVAATGR